LHRTLSESTIVFEVSEIRLPNQLIFDDAEDKWGRLDAERLHEIVGIRIRENASGSWAKKGLHLLDEILPSTSDKEQIAIWLSHLRGHL
jgi:hypothetical protein